VNRTEFIKAVTETFAEWKGEQGEWSKADVKTCLEAMEAVITESLYDDESVTLAGFVKFATRFKPATKARKGRNPFTGEMTTFKAKPETTVVKITPLKKFKDAVAG
jgi:DNA-binding protein HU-beta